MVWGLVKQAILVPKTEIWVQYDHVDLSDWVTSKVFYLDVTLEVRING